MLHEVVPVDGRKLSQALVPGESKCSTEVRVECRQLVVVPLSQSSPLVLSVPRVYYQVQLLANALQRSFPGNLCISSPKHSVSFVPAKDGCAFQPQLVVATPLLARYQQGQYPLRLRWNVGPELCFSEDRILAVVQNTF